MCTRDEPAVPSSPVQALAMLHASLGYLASCDAAGLATAVQAEALIGLEQAEARHTAARARILAAFTAQDGYQADGQYGPKAWLRALTKVTKHAAAGATGWARRLAAHPVIAGALAAAQLSTSWARQVCDWTDQLPEDHRDDADQILLAAAVGGADLHDLGALAREMIQRSRTGPDRDGDNFNERARWLDTTIGGAGRLQGDLTPACAAALAVVLDALAGRAGPEDTRTVLQRRHDGLEEACQRLIGARMLPGRDGQPVHVQVHVDLATLQDQPGTPGAAGGPRFGAGPGKVHRSGAGSAQRDKRCQFPGCAQPPPVCQVHHLIPRSKGGATALGNLRLLCRLCRRRHNRHYADVLVMPMPSFPALVAGVGGLSEAA